MHRSPRLLARALARVVFVLVVLVAGCGTPIRTSSGDLPAPPAATHAPVTVPGAVQWTTLADRIDDRDRFYTWASHLPAPHPAVAAHPRPADVVVDGDRFDRLAACESTMNQNADDGQGHLSYFQWLLSTFHSAGGVGDPRDVDYQTQKRLAMYWATVADPFRQWPSCWPRSAG